MSLDVRLNHLLMIQNILDQHLPNQSVIAFGSRVKDTAQKTSDLDLCIMGEQSLSFEAMAHLRDAFSLSTIPYKIDIVEWANVSPAFQKIITHQPHIKINRSSFSIA
jgi:predicted nucleotidyltransferase